MVNANAVAEIKTRMALSAKRNAALAAGDIATFQALTTQIAALPMTGVAPLTAKAIQKWNKRRG